MRSFSIEGDAFDPWKTGPVQHRSGDHPFALQSPSLIEFGRLIERLGSTPTHRNAAYVGTPFIDALAVYPSATSSAKTLADVQHASDWLSLISPCGLSQLACRAYGTVRRGVKRLAGRPILASNVPYAYA